MDDTGMTEADKVGLVEDVLAIWGEDAAQEFAERYGVDLEALRRAPAAAALKPTAIRSLPGRTHGAVQPISHLWTKSRYKLVGATALLAIPALITGLPLEPLAFSPRAILKVIIPAEVGTIVTGTILIDGFALGYAVRAFVSRRRRFHAKKYRGVYRRLSRVPIC